MLPIALMAGLGALQGIKQDDQQKRDAMLRAAEIQYSPWSGLKQFSEIHQSPGILGNAASGAVAGYGLQQNIDKANSDNLLNDSLVARNNAQANYWASLQKKQK